MTEITFIETFPKPFGDIICVDRDTITEKILAMIKQYSPLRRNPLYISLREHMKPDRRTMVFTILAEGAMIPSVHSVQFNITSPGEIQRFNDNEMEYIAFCVVTACGVNKNKISAEYVTFCALAYGYDTFHSYPY